MRRPGGYTAGLLALERERVRTTVDRSKRGAHMTQHASQGNTAPDAHAPRDFAEGEEEHRPGAAA